MAVSKVVYITSYYNGVARLYIMTKDGNNITTNLVLEQPTNEHNGLEITVKNINDVSKYQSSVNQLAFFPNVYVDGAFNESNKIKVKRFKYFSFATYNFVNKILLGNVLYPLDYDIIPSELIDFCNGLNKSGVVFNFNIGELNVTPNRESIIYNSKVKEVIINRIKEAKAEIEGILTSTIGGDYNSPVEYYEICTSFFGYDFIENKKIPTYTTSYTPKFRLKDLNIPVTFYGKKINPGVVISVGKLRPLNIRAVSDGYKLWKDKFPWQANRIIDNVETPIIILKPTDKITKYIRDYLTKNYNSFIVCTEFSEVAFSDEVVRSCLPWNRNTMTDDESFTTKKCWEFMKKRFVKIDFDTDSKFLTFKDEVKKAAKTNKPIINEKVILSLWEDGREWSYKRDFNNYNAALNYIKSKNKGVLIRNLDATAIAPIASSLGYVVIAANKKAVELLNNEPLKCKITEEDIYNHKKVKICKALIESKFIDYLPMFSANFKKTLPFEFTEFIKYCNDTIIREVRRCSLDFDKVTIDEDAYNKCVTIINCYKSYKELIDSLDLNISENFDLRPIISYLVMKNKLYKISYDCYKTMKENKLLKAICEK